MNLNGRLLRYPSLLECRGVSGAGRTSSDLLGKKSSCSRARLRQPPLHYTAQLTAQMDRSAVSILPARVTVISRMLHGIPALGGNRTGVLNLGHLWRRRISKEGDVWQLARASPSQRAAFEPVASAPSAPDVTLAQKVRALCFYLTTFMVSALGFLVMLIFQPFVLMFDKHRRRVPDLLNKVGATLITSLFYKIEIEGRENLPGADEGVVYVANHQSFLDIYTLYQLGRPFKFISKTTIFRIPLIGWIMYLTGHIPLKRTDKKSQIECIRTCLKLVKQGVSFMFFPEGTRTKDGALAAFKKGAFIVAAKGRVPIVPIAIIGSGKLMPNGFEYILKGPSVIKMIIHPPLRNNNANQLCEESRDSIAKTLIKHGLSVH